MAIIDQQIQTGIFIQDRTPIIRGSNGTLYCAYTKISGSNNIFCAYSSDGGLTWNESNSGVIGDTPVIAIDSQDIIHLVYLTGPAIKYNQFTIAGGWTIVETVSSIGSNYKASSSIGVAVDSLDNVHVSYNNNTSIYYNKRTSGVWGTESNLFTSDVLINNGANKYPQLVIDSHNYLYIVFLDRNISVKYLKYTSFWTAAVEIGSTSVSSVSVPNLAVDSLDNVHVIWGRSTAKLAYTKYTFLSDSWSAEAIVVTTNFSTAPYPTISVDSNNNLNVVFQDTSSPDIFFIQNNGSWGSDSDILDASGANAFSKAQIQSTVWPLIGGVHTNVPTSGYQFSYINTVATVNILRFYSSTDINFPAPQTKNYSRKASASLPSSDSNLTNLFSPAGYGNVLTEDSVFEDQTATDQYSIFLFKNKGNSSSDPINISWIGKSSLAPTTSAVVLQIYNRNSGLWETLDSNSSSAADTPFTLEGSVTSSLSNYYDGNKWVSCRVYQLAQ